jgi:hypothetical protein
MVRSFLMKAKMDTTNSKRGLKLLRAGTEITYNLKNPEKVLRWTKNFYKLVMKDMKSNKKE